MPAVKPIPDGYRTLTPYLIVNDGNAAALHGGKPRQGRPS
jgi:hypothetical protein